MKSDILGHTGVHYELFVRAFCDTNHDGLGDLNGVTAKLDYLQNLGITAIWLMPINPSPSYHKYDVTDYYSIDRDYGTLDDFRRLITEAHQRGIRMIMDFVINHTSSQHPWFREAIKGPDNPYWNWYVWMKPAAIKALHLETRALTADSQERNPWHSVPGAPYDDRYYALFWEGMPDLNFDHPPVREAVYAAGRFWLENVGVDGFRLDAARHIYPEWEEPKNHAFWQEFREKMETTNRSVGPVNVYLVGEVWTRPYHIAPYFRGLKANFNFDLRLSIETIVRNEDDTEEIIAFLADSHAAFEQVNPQFIDALILSNHDQNRIGSLLNGHPDWLKVTANLLLTLPGNPYLYYGEEIGMLGLKPDENIREPFLWNIGKSDPDRARWRRAKYSTSRTVRPLAQQQADPNSLFSHYKRLIHYRNNHPVLNDNLSRLEQSNIRQTGIVAFVRRGTNGQRVLVVHNLSRNPTTVPLPPDEQANFKTLVYQSVAITTFLPEGLLMGAYSVAVLEA